MKNTENFQKDLWSIQINGMSIFVLLIAICTVSFDVLHTNSRRDLCIDVLS